MTYYRIDVARTTSEIQSELDRLSKQLVDGAKLVSSRPEIPVGPTEIPSRVGLQESIKARVSTSLESKAKTHVSKQPRLMHDMNAVIFMQWNETVEDAVRTVRQTDFTAVAASAFDSLKESLARTPSPSVAVEQAAPASRQV